MKILLADFETSPFNDLMNDNYELKPKFICFLDYNTNEKSFLNIEQKGLQCLKNYLLKLINENNGVRIYFHNLRFDLAFLYDCLPKKYNYKIIKNNSKIIQFKLVKEYVRKDKRKQYITKLDIRDSLSLLPTSIETLGKTFDLPKLKIDYNSEITNEYITYCFRDLEILQKSLSKLIEFVKIHFDYDINIKDLPLTFPSLSKRIFNFINIRKFGNTIFNDIYHQSIEYIEPILREYYFGGRVEVFDFNKLNDGYYNDVNSMFPFIMLTNDFPIGKIEKFSCCNQEKCWKKWKDIKRVFGAICYVYENQEYPLIPTKINDKLIFSNGKKKCFLFRKEIEYLQSLNQKIELIDLYICQDYLPIFKEFIEIMYSVKQKSNPNSYDYLMSKLYMVSLYGKFAEKKEKEQIEIVNNEFNTRFMTEKELNQTSFDFDDMKGYIKRTNIVNTSLKTNIVFSMMITALSRMKLHQEILKSNKPYYCDTDSIVSKNLIENSKEIGHLKPEMVFKSFQALGCKEYIIELNNSDKCLIKMKGFGKLESNDFNDFICNFENGKKQNRLIGFMESFKRNIPFNTMLVFDKYKQLLYDKRFINDDLTTKPFNLDIDDFNGMIENNKIQLRKIINKYKSELNKL